MNLLEHNKQQELASLRDKNILVTGAAGFIGSHLTDLLLQKDAQVVGYDNLYSGDMKNLDNVLNNSKFTFIKADILDEKRLKTVLNKHQIELIFHLAALTDIQSSIKDPLLTHRVNTTGTIKLVSTAMNANVKRLIFTSSAAVYGDPITLPVQENVQSQPISPYGASKASAEKYIQSLVTTSSLEYVILRYFNVYGPRQLSSKYSGVIATFIKRLLKKKAPIIYGDGSQTRNFIFVKDIVDATIRASQSNIARNSIINVASKDSCSILDLTNLLLKLSNQKIDPIFQPSRSGDILHSRADITRLENTLNWTQQYSLEEGLELTLNWFKNQN